MARFCRIWLGALIALLALVAAFNLVVDPYLVFGMPRIAGFNALKPGAETHERMVKTYQLERRRPVTVILGSSRADNGIDPASRFWPARLRPIYNLAIDGASQPELLAFLREAWATGRLKGAIVQLDFENFLWFQGKVPAASGTMRRFLPAASHLPPRVRFLQRLHDMFLATLTLGALKDSVTTVFEQTKPVPTLTRDGYATDAIFRRWIAADGTRALFVQKTPEDMWKALRGARNLARGDPPLPQMASLRAMIAFCRAHHIRLTLLVPAMPAALLEIFDQAGIWPDFIAWQRALVKALPADGSVTLWDFAGWNRYALEPEPATRDQPTRWFWELTHFTPALGDRMIARMEGRGRDPGFGLRLTAPSLPGWVAAQQRANLAHACGPDPAPLLAPWPSPPRYASPCAGARAAASP